MFPTRLRKTILRQLLWVAMPGAVLVLLSVSCGGDDDKPAGSATPRSGSGPQVAMSDLLKFDPSEIAVISGEPIVLRVDNSDSAMLHDFSIEKIAVTGVAMSGESDNGHDMDAMDFDLHLALDGGSTGTLTFTPTESGEYVFFCSVSGHKEAGMEGKLRVS